MDAIIRKLDEPQYDDDGKLVDDCFTEKDKKQWKGMLQTANRPFLQIFVAAGAETAEDCHWHVLNTKREQSVQIATLTDLVSTYVNDSKPNIYAKTIFIVQKGKFRSTSTADTASQPQTSKSKSPSTSDASIVHERVHENSNSDSKEQREHTDKNNANHNHNHNHNQQQTKKRKIVKLKLSNKESTTSPRHQNKNKRCRESTENITQYVHRPPPKKRQRRHQESGTAKECLWILVDSSCTFDRRTEQGGINRMQRITECVTKIVRRNWELDDVATHSIALYTYGEELVQETEPLCKTATNQQTILSKLRDMRKWRSITHPITTLKAVDRMLDIVIEAKNRRRYRCDRHRIVLFACTIQESEIYIKLIEDKLKKNEIVLDVIQVTYSHRSQSRSVAQLVRSVNNGRYFCPSRSETEWQSCVTNTEFVYPEKRNCCTDVITLD